MTRRAPKRGKRLAPSPRSLTVAPGPRQSASSPLLAARLAWRRTRSSEALARLQGIEARIGCLRDPNTSFADRLTLISEFAAEGWNEFPDWPEIKQRWMYAGKEWRICLNREQLKALAGSRRQDAYRDITAAHLEQHPELRERIIADPTGLHFLVVWVAFQLWAGDDRYSGWLLEQVDHALLDIRARLGRRVRPDDLPPLYQGDAKSVLRQEGYARLLEEIIPAGVYFVTGQLDHYWQAALRNYFKQILRRSPLERSKGRSRLLDQMTWEVAQEFDHQRDVEAQLEATKALDVARQLLSPRQQQIIMLQLADDDRPTNEQIAKRLAVSLSTVEKDRRQIIEVMRGAFSLDS